MNGDRGLKHIMQTQQLDTSFIIESVIMMSQKYQGILQQEDNVVEKGKQTAGNGFI